MSQNLINCLYSHFKNNPKKLKIVCDGDEVIQPLEPKVYYELSEREGAYYEAPGGMPNGTKFEEGFQNFGLNPPIYYSDYGSHSLYTEKDTVKSCLRENDKFALGERSIKYKIDKIKNEPSFYQQTPFLTIAKELLKLVRKDKIEHLIFLTAYDKKKFPNEDFRKQEIFKETFGKFSFCSLQLIGFDSEKRGVNKADWIKYNAKDFDVLIDDNPNICKSIIKSNNHFLVKPCKDCMKKYMGGCRGKTSYSCGNCRKMNITVFAPYYPAVEDQHDEKVLLIKTSISDLKKTDY